MLLVEFTLVALARELKETFIYCLTHISLNFKFPCQVCEWNCFCKRFTSPYKFMVTLK